MASGNSYVEQPNNVLTFRYLPARLAKHIVGEYDEYKAMNDYLDYIRNMAESDPVKKSQLVEAYADSQMLLLIVAMCIAVPVAVATFFMRDIDLRKKDEEEEAERVNAESELPLEVNS